MFALLRYPPSFVAKGVCSVRQCYLLPFQGTSLPMLAVEAQYIPILVTRFFNLPFLALETCPQSLIVRIHLAVT